VCGSRDVTIPKLLGFGVLGSFEFGGFGFWVIGVLGFGWFSVLGFGFGIGLFS
jgi:hypothetical protein